MGPHTNGPTPPPDAEDAVTQAMDGLRRLVRILRLSSTAAERQAGLSSAQLFVLREVQAAGSLSINELAERTHTHQSSVSVVVARLTARGLLVRNPSPADRRRVEVSLTSDGQSRLSDAPAVAQTRLIAGLAKMPEGDRDALVRGLQSWVRTIGADQDPADLFFEAEGGPSDVPGGTL